MKRSANGSVVPVPLSTALKTATKTSPAICSKGWRPPSTATSRISSRPCPRTRNETRPVTGNPSAARRPAFSVPPECLRGTTQGAGGGPESFPVAQNFSGVAPKCSGGAPESFSGTPAVAGGGPESFRGPPKSSGGPPECFRGCLKMSEVPQNKGVYPHNNQPTEV